MSTVIVNKIDFESTSNNRISYASNTITFGAGGSDVISINSTALSVSNLVSASVNYLLSNGTIVANTLTVSSNANIQVYGQINFNGVVTPTAINVNTSAFAPGANNTIIRFSANTSNNTQLSLYGMVAGVNGQIVILSNIGTKNVIIENESPSESTAGNRFSLPENITLNGYQSMTVIYDGTSARWKSTDLSYKSFYKGFLSKGFISGGATISGVVPAITRTAVVTADRITYDTEAISAVSGANLSTARDYMVGAGNTCKAFFSGGSTPTIVATSDRTTYATESTAAVPGANLSQARYTVGAAGNSDKAFFSGGQNSATTPFMSVVADRTTYASETTAAVSGANLTQARVNKAFSNNDKAFFSGGGTSPAAPYSSVATTDRTTHATETTAAVSGANLTQARTCAGSAGNSIKGYFSGGSTCSIGFSNRTCRTTYATETTSFVPGANLSQNRAGTAGAGNLEKAFFGGGINFTIPTYFARTTVDRINYSNDTIASAPGIALSQARTNAGSA